LALTFFHSSSSQGFPDWYKFHGNILDKHRQVGNAVAPQMGLALGLEIRKAVAASAGLKENKAVKEEEETEVAVAAKKEEEDDDE
jgi:DNA (cytosine-5)-methyltransferase 1